MHTHTRKADRVQDQDPMNVVHRFSCIYRETCGLSLTDVISFRLLVNLKSPDARIYTDMPYFAFWRSLWSASSRKRQQRQWASSAVAGRVSCISETCTPLTCLKLHSSRPKRLHVQQTSAEVTKKPSNSPSARGGLQEAERADNTYLRGTAKSTVTSNGANKTHLKCKYWLRENLEYGRLGISVCWKYWFSSLDTSHS